VIEKNGPAACDSRTFKATNNSCGVNAISAAQLQVIPAEARWPRVIAAIAAGLDREAPR
jgi:hypothetical protein